MSNDRHLKTDGQAWEWEPRGSELDGLVTISQLLNSVVNDLRSKALVLFVAPAGFGKSALIDILTKQRRNSLSSGENNLSARAPALHAARPVRPTMCFVIRLTRKINDPNAFVELLIRGINEQWAAYHAGSGDLLAETSDEVVHTGPADRVTSLLNALNGPVELVIDEYHLAQRPDVDCVLRDIIQGMSDNTCVVVASRTMPDIGARKMVMQGDAAHYGVRDFAFTSAETARLFDNRLSPMNAEEMTALSGGWPASLSEAKRWLGGACIQGDIRPYFLPALSAIFPYFHDEVFSALPDNLQKALEELSVLPTFDVHGVRAILGLPNAEQVMARISKLDGFVIRIDHPASVYRLHPVMRAFLTERLAERCGLDRFDHLCRNAALFHLEGPTPWRAISYALRTGDEKFVREVATRVEISLPLLIMDMEFFDEFMENYETRCDFNIPQMRPSQALQALRGGSLRRGEKFLDEARAALTENNQNLHGEQIGHIQAEIRFVEAFGDLYTGPSTSDEIIDRLQDIRTITYSGDRMYTGLLCYTLSTLLLRKGKLTEAHFFLDRAIRDFDRAGSSSNLIIASFQQGMQHILEGKLALVIDRDLKLRSTVADTMQRQATHRALAMLFGAQRLFERGDVDMSSILAKQAFDVIVECEDYWPELLTQACRLASVSAYSAEGFVSAQRIVADGISLASRRGYEPVKKALQGIHIHLAAVDEQSGLVEEMQQSYGCTFGDVRFENELGYWWREQSYLLLGLIRHEINQKRSSVAIETISKYRPVFERNQLQWFSQKLSVLEALAVHECDPAHKAGNCDAEAAKMIVPVINAAAQAYGSLSVFLTEGRAAKRLLTMATLRYRRVGPGDLDGLKQNLMKMHEYWFRYNQYAVDKKAPLPRLTSKQLTVLKMIAANLSYKQMSEKAQVTEGAIFHILESLKEKFQVETREEIGALVRYLGFLGDC